MVELMPTTCHHPQYGQDCGRAPLTTRAAMVAASALEAMAARVVGQRTPCMPRR